MNEHIVFGLFALSVATISLIEVLSGKHDALLSLLRRFWGRKAGHTIYFLSHVATPLLVCILCLGWGIRQYDPSPMARHGLSAYTEVLRLEIRMPEHVPHQITYPDNFALWEKLVAA